MEPVSSFVSLAEQITQLNKNNIEILTKINDLVSSQKDTVNIVYDNNGVVSSYAQPTVGWLKNQVDIVNQNMKRMASIDGYTYIRDGQSFKRIMTSDLNREPAPISSINQVSTFTPVDNWFFESLMNPMLAVTIDLTNKVEQTTNQILSRRYIMRFEKNPDGSLTEAGLTSFNSFTTTFLNRADINITDFLAWYNNPTNTGMLVDTVEPYDEQVYDLKLKSLNYYGIFSVIKVEIDEINNKMWYHLNDIKYYGADGTVKSLTIGDEVIVNKLNASSRYRILEVNTDSSNTKIRVENIEGYDPIIVGTNVLKYYSDVSNIKSVQINVGFDEYIVEFVKPINTDDNIVGSLWSLGISFYTNDLLLDTNNNINLATYYIQSVYDYGTLLRDLLSKKIPTVFGQIPNPVVLTDTNFKVVQTNEHLTSDVDQNTLKKLHSSKSTVKTQISQLNTALTQKMAQLNVGGLTTTQKQAQLSEINKLQTDMSISTSNLSSILTQINDVSTGVNKSVQPTYSVRGFWRMPEPILTNNTNPQHVCQFRIQYRKSSKSGNSNNIQTFNYVNVQAPPASTSGTSGVSIRNVAISGGASIAAALSTGNASVNNSGRTPTPPVNTGKSTPIESTQVSTTTENPSNGPQYANFSNWFEFLSDVRKRYYDNASKQWYWKIEDVSDADTPNINQLDIPILPNERIEIRVKSISEVGWPDSLIESDWSNVLAVDFPDDLSSIISDNQFILLEASQDQNTLALQNTLSSKGVDQHVSDSYTNNQSYVAHKDSSIQVGLPTDQAQNPTLFQYLNYLTNRIAALEQQLNGVKGTLNISLYKQTTLIKNIDNNSSTIINIECEDYGTLVSGRTYVNAVNVIEDYAISLENTNQSGNLGFLSARYYTTGGTNAFYSPGGEANKILLVDYNNNLYTQNDNQFVWFADRDNNTWISTGATNGTDSPYYLDSPSYNLGIVGNNPLGFQVENMFGRGIGTNLTCAVFPYLPDINNFVENGQDKTKIVKPGTKFNIGLKIFFKFDGNMNTSTPTTPTYYTPGESYANPSNCSPNNVSKTRKVKFWFETTDNTTYQFVITFNLNRYKTYLKPKTSASIVESV
jgi:hypothetical protein